MTCTEKREICFGGGAGYLQFRRGELGWRRRRRNREEKVDRVVIY
jgi:hypothetical protein